MVQKPEEYKWTSYHANAWGDAGWIELHTEYVELGEDKLTRCFAYRELFRYQIEAENLHRLRKSIH